MEKSLKIIKNGILIGLILFVTVFWGIYFIAGNTAFEQEILNLTNINTYTKLILDSSIIGILIVGLVEYIKFICEKIKENEKETDMKKSIKRVILFGSSIMIITILIVAVIIKIGKSYNKILGMMICIICMLIMCAYGVIVFIKAAIEESLINKKIKEKNRE